MLRSFLFLLRLVGCVLLFDPVPGRAADPVTAPKWTPLLDEKLSSWEIWMGVPHQTVTGLPEGTPTSPDGHQGTPLGLGNDPKHVFSVDGRRRRLAGVSEAFAASAAAKSR